MTPRSVVNVAAVCCLFATAILAARAGAPLGVVAGLIVVGAVALLVLAVGIEHEFQTHSSTRRRQP